MEDGTIKNIVREFNYGTKHFTIVACKGSFVHVFILSSTGKLIRTMSQHVPNLFITGKCREDISHKKKRNLIRGNLFFFKVVIDSAQTSTLCVRWVAQFKN